MRVMPAVTWRPRCRSAATAEFDYRYVTTALPFACLAAAMTFSPADLARRGARGGPDGRLTDAGHDQRDLAADAT